MKRLLKGNHTDFPFAKRTHGSYSSGEDDQGLAKSYDLMTINRISIENWHLSLYTISTLIQIYWLILGNQKI